MRWEDVFKENFYFLNWFRDWMEEERAYFGLRSWSCRELLVLVVVVVTQFTVDIYTCIYILLVRYNDCGDPICA